MKHSTNLDRQSNFELLRIITMVMIIGCHFATHGGFNFDSQTITISRLWWNVIEMGGDFGTNIFVLISGYFMICEKDLSKIPHKIMKLWLQIFYYSIVLFFVAFLLGKSDSSLKNIIKTFFPISFPQWWFASTYFVLLLVYPYLNKLLSSFSKCEYQRFILFFFLIWSVIPTFTTSYFESNALIVFMFLYSIGGYIKLFGLPQKKTSFWLLMWGFFTAVTFLSSVVLMIMGAKIGIFRISSWYFYSARSVLTILRAVCFFMAFSTINIRPSRLINIISSATFGVYLLHESSLSQQYLWNNIFHNASFQNTTLIIPYSLVVTIIVYLSCTAIDLGRKYLLENPLQKLIIASANKVYSFLMKATEQAKIIIFGRED